MAATVAYRDSPFGMMFLRERTAFQKNDLRKRSQNFSRTHLILAIGIHGGDNPKSVLGKVCVNRLERDVGEELSPHVSSETNRESEPDCRVIRRIQYLAVEFQIQEEEEMVIAQKNKKEYEKFKI